MRKCGVLYQQNRGNDEKKGSKADQVSGSYEKSSLKMQHDLVVTITPPVTGIGDEFKQTSSSNECGDDSEITKPFLSLALSNGLGVDSALALKNSGPASEGMNRKSSPRVRRSASAIPLSHGNSLLTTEHTSVKRRSSDRSLRKSSQSIVNTVSNTTNIPPSRSSSAKLTEVAALLTATSKNVRERISAVSRKDNKAARMLAAIIVAFVATWLPYNILVLISTLCENCVNDALWKVSYWLCYLNSTINPLCYALCSKDFRETFRQILCCSKKEKAST